MRESSRASRNSSRARRLSSWSKRVQLLRQTIALLVGQVVLQPAIASHHEPVPGWRRWRNAVGRRVRPDSPAPLESAAVPASAERPAARSSKPDLPAVGNSLELIGKDFGRIRTTPAGQVVIGQADHRGCISGRLGVKQVGGPHLLGTAVNDGASIRVLAKRVDSWPSRLSARRGLPRVHRIRLAIRSSTSSAVDFGCCANRSATRRLSDGYPPTVQLSIIPSTEERDRFSQCSATRSMTGR